MRRTRGGEKTLPMNIKKRIKNEMRLKMEKAVSKKLVHPHKKQKYRWRRLWLRCSGPEPYGRKHQTFSVSHGEERNKGGEIERERDKYSNRIDFFLS